MLKLIDTTVGNLKLGLSKHLDIQTFVGSHLFTIKSIKFIFICCFYLVTYLELALPRIRAHQ